MPYSYTKLQPNSLPIPQVSMEVWVPSRVSLVREIEAAIDTGAAMTCVPRRIIEELGEHTLIYRPRTVSSVLGEKKKVKAYFVHLQIGICSFQNFEVLAIDKDYAVIGRDILNGYRILLDGPKGIWKVQKVVDRPSN